MPTVYIDGIAHEVEAGKNMLQVALSLGYDLPYFCWHPALDSVGACRQCAVIQFKGESDTKGSIQMACMLAANDGTRISIEHPEAREFRAQVIEWLMVNHPHDCPVCDEGGECHLQDMTVMTGHNYRKYRFNKRTHRNQNLGPFVNHEMNRCITCYRCVRFYNDYAGGEDFGVFGAHDYAYFGRHADGVLESEFAGNLVEVCPTGVFTDKTLKRHYARKWDLQSGPSVCQHCGVGCNILAGTRYGRLVRILNRYNHEVNGYFICDRGRFGYEFVNSDKRIRRPARRLDRNLPAEPVTGEEGVSEIASLVKGNSKVIGIGSPRASLESNFALRTLVGPQNFYWGLAEREHRLINKVIEALRSGPARSASLHDVGASDAVLILGEDVTNTAPMLDLAIRQAILNQPRRRVAARAIAGFNDVAVRDTIQADRGPLFIATPAPTKLDKQARATYRATPDDVARLGFAVANAINPSCPAVSDLPDELRETARGIAEALKSAAKPLVISGTSLGSERIIEAAANVAWALSLSGSPAGICYTAPECNSLGAGLLSGGHLEQAFEKIEAGQADSVVIIENDLYRRLDAGGVDSALGKCRHVVVIDHTGHRTSSKADYVLPAATFAEGSGTIVSSEGRAQRYFRAMSADTEIRESWRWIRDLMSGSGNERGSGWNTLDEIRAAMFAELPIADSGDEIAPGADFRIEGLKIARSPARFSGRTAMGADKDVNEPKPPDDVDSALSFSMEGYQGTPPGALTPFYWAPGWNSVQATAKYQAEVNGPLRGGDPGRRLIEPKKDSMPSFYAGIPEAFRVKPDEWLAVPLYHIYGSEELSAMAAGVGTLVPSAYLGISASALEKLNMKADELVSATIGGREHRLPCRVVDGLPEGVVGLPIGLPDLTGVALPAWIRIRTGDES